VYRSDDDLALLAELAGVLDQTVAEHGLSSGTYLVLRQLVRADGPTAITAMAEHLSADSQEVADMAGRLAAAGLAEVAGGGLRVTGAGRDLVAEVETSANQAMRDYVVERPHTATVYGLVASMQSGRFTVEDLLEFLAEGPTEEQA
jgi:DNA-binding MarR family transcriptional regulator